MTLISSLASQIVTTLATVPTHLRRILILGKLLLIMGILLIIQASPVQAADHLEAPFVRLDGRTDINDVYVFHPGNPQNLNRIVLALTVNPDAGVTSPDRFSENAIYDLLIDQNGDAIEDLIFRTVFASPDSGGDQEFNLFLIQSDGSSELLAAGPTDVIVQGGQDSLVFAGLRDDPFFFDEQRFAAGATFCFDPPPNGVGDNFFFGFNVSTVVIEVPTSLLGSGQVGIWGVTRA